MKWGTPFASLLAGVRQDSHILNRGAVIDSHKPGLNTRIIFSVSQLLYDVADAHVGNGTGGIFIAGGA